MENNGNNLNNDDFVIGKGFTVADDTVQNGKKQKAVKHRRLNPTVKNIIWIVSIFIISICIACGVIYAAADYLGIGFGRGNDCQMEVIYGESVSDISEKLQESGAVKIPVFFRVYSKLKGYENDYKYGLYTFNTEIGYEEIAQMLMNEGAKAENVTVTIPEGTGINDYVKNVNGEDVTVKGIATILEEKGVCSKSDFYSALKEIDYNSRLLKNVNAGKTYYELEGYLFPETYNFYSYDSEECARLVVKRMIDETESRISDGMYDRANELGYSMNEILTMASIVQMEAGNNTQEMKNVAAVFYNRLNSDEFSTLGSSPTCYYGESFKNDDGRYNTYNIKGLPPGPLCSPGIDAINAALYPNNSIKQCYFITDSEGNFYYHDTLAQQEQTINSLKQKDKWIYEYFD